jgi:hypothetical protein
MMGFVASGKPKSECWSLRATLQGSVPASTAIWAWSASEPVRYFYLLLNSVGLSPYWLLWVRCVTKPRGLPVLIPHMLISALGFRTLKKHVCTFVCHT